MLYRRLPAALAIRVTPQVPTDHQAEVAPPSRRDAERGVALRAPVSSAAQISRTDLAALEAAAQAHPLLFVSKTALRRGWPVR